MKRVFSTMLAAMLITTSLPSASLTASAASTNNNYVRAQQSSTESQKGTLVWEDNFDGDSLNLNDWNYETHEPGWVNNELQEYTNSTKNIFVRDGKLVLKGIKEETAEGTKYTSGKITTQNKHDFKYGRFEASIKVPEGQGLWPAFWMMPTEEGLYGAWPKCGEIDIMETLGHQTDIAYGTIHYGDPHNEQQGVYKLPNGQKFSDDYHVYAVEWEPGEMRFYIDGNLYHTVNDWFTKVEGGEEVTYPAPFDQPFYLQLNLAIGGNWPGNPDETTDFNKAEVLVDYVRVYQKDSYDENVKKPEKKPVVLREPDATGNFINNGNFAVAEDLTDDVDWKFLLANGGEGKAEIKDGKVVVTSTQGGTVDYSLQLLQPNLPLKKNGKYRITFDAKAAENRNMILNVTSPDRSYVRQFPDTVVDLTQESKTYSYDFVMKDDDDANARLEFNFGNRGSLADVELTNVRVEKIGEVEASNEDVKTILPDGNYVYNGTFDVGEDRMKHWEVESNAKDAKVSVTNNNNVRELKAEVPSTVKSLSDVKVKETALGISPNKEYYFSFDAYGDADKSIKAQIAGKTFDANITTEKKNFKFKLKTDKELTNTDLEFLLGAAGVTYIDNVKIVDTSLIINGDFDKEFSKWQVFTDSSVSSAVSSKINNVDGNNEAEINIEDTGDADWKIQLKQTGVKLEKGKKYKLSLDAKSTLDRVIKYTIQRDGSSDNDWRPYVPTKTIEVGKDYKNYEIEFEMTEESDPNSIFTISMGGLDGNQITDKHTITVDNVKLEEVVDNPQVGEEETPGIGSETNPGTGEGTTPGTEDPTNPGTEKPSDSDTEKPSNPANKPSKGGSTKTGDMAQSALYLTLLAAGGAIMAFGAKKREDEE